MDDSAKIELENSVSLYQFHVNTYIKGIIVFLAITGALFKFSIESNEYRKIYAAAGILCGIAILIPLVFSFIHEKKIKEDFKRLAQTTNTNPISTSPLCMLSRVTAFFWVIISGAWWYILLYFK